MLYAVDGSRNIVTVAGTSPVGAQSLASGAINTITVDGTTITGLFHSSGATNVFLSATEAIKGNQHPCGALNVSVSPYVPNTNRVTVVGA